MKRCRYGVMQNLQLNFIESKCSVLRISHKTNKVECSYQIIESKLTLVNKIKDLGIVLTSKLDWNEHVINIIAKKQIEC